MDRYTPTARYGCIVSDYLHVLRFTSVVAAVNDQQANGLAYLDTESEHPLVLQLVNQRKKPYRIGLWFDFCCCY